ncbi:hypothetical protein TS65_14170 [Aneurinibacillus migulanus]|uniref:Uncharacterized protein n=1 Tax=Aneurinibacillus migulanus TaxID=47500 RepID=A0A0D1XMP1_ANEMI|nr:hypothetical protein TS65_14170 [Aneurinibacillus migulanus]KON95844.1 hypothetical protein AF333_10465 [Aneurinibacillus migulanus]GED17226.1 hypothetical protein AMI01nite_52170 [Aneurinibacillus migulanus]
MINDICLDFQDKNVRHEIGTLFEDKQRGRSEGVDFFGFKKRIHNSISLIFLHEFDAYNQKDLLFGLK